LLSSCLFLILRSDEITERIAISFRELFHNRRGPRLLITNPLEPTPWLDYKSAMVRLFINGDLGRMVSVGRENEATTGGCQGRFEIRPKGGGKLDQFLG
jgi:hypothetical protein